MQLHHLFLQTNYFPPPVQFREPDAPLSIFDYIKWGGGAFLVIWFVSLVIRPVNALKNWHHHFDGLKLSAQDVYEKIYVSLQERKFPDVKAGYTKRFEAGIFSPRRLYLTIQYKKFFIDICCMPYGTGYYMSWFLSENDPGFISHIPILRDLFGKNPKFKSYYQSDIALLFQSGVHDVIMHVIDELIDKHGLRPLSEFDRRPNIGTW